MEFKPNLAVTEKPECAALRTRVWRSTLRRRPPSYGRTQARVELSSLRTMGRTCLPELCRSPWHGFRRWCRTGRCLQKDESYGTPRQWTAHVLHSYFWWQWEVISTFLCRGGMGKKIGKMSYRRFFCVHFGEQLSHPAPPFPILGFFGFLTKSHKETIRKPRDPPHHLNGDMTPPWTQKHQTNPPGFWETWAVGQLTFVICCDLLCFGGEILHLLPRYSIGIRGYRLRSVYGYVGGYTWDTTEGI